MTSFLSVKGNKLASRERTRICFSAKLAEHDLPPAESLLFTCFFIYLFHNNRPRCAQAISALIVAANSCRARFSITCLASYSFFAELPHPARVRVLRTHTRTAQHVHVESRRTSFQRRFNARRFVRSCNSFDFHKREDLRGF